MDDVSEVKSRMDIVQLVGETVRLRKAGTNFKGLCPFHQEKTPSFMVSPERSTYHCFGCEEGGDIFEFVMKREHIDFAEALRMLATRVGVQLTGHDPKDSQKKQRLFEVNTQATNYFQAALKHTAGKAARDYLVRRGIAEKTAKEFKIGYAPDSFESLVTALRGKGFKDQELLDAGVAGMGGRGLYARFRNRLMIPIADSSGAIRGFTGRLLDDQAKEAKYVNTSETSLFHKGKLVFALDKAKSEIIKQEGSVLVEGQMDVIAAHQAGTTHVVATSGTAMTENQLRQLTRYAPTITLALDNDAAGRKAMMRIVELVGDQEVELKVVDLGSAKDPDELITADQKRWKKALKEARPVIDFLTGDVLKRHTRPYSREAINDVLNTVLAALKYRGALDQDYYTEQLSSTLGVEKISVKAKLAAPTPAAAPPMAARGSTTNAVTAPVHKRPDELVTERLLGLATITAPLLPKLAALNVAIFPIAYRSLAAALPQNLDAGVVNGYDEQTLSDFDRTLLSVCVLAAAEYEPMIESERAAEFDRLLARLQLLWGKQHQPKLLAAIKRAEESGDTNRRNSLMEEYTSLTKRISHGRSK